MDKDKLIGTRLDGRYELTELVGEGGMANVYRATDVLDNRMVAVKILKTEYSESEEFQRRFRNESKAIAMMSHPNIVKIYDMGFSDKMQYIVMEYIDGITLKDYIDSEQVLNWKDAVHFVIQILRALQHAHSRGIVHRDIKPQNIMLLTDGTIKVMDFGIAKFAREESRTATDQAIGTVHYISPEQARGDVTDAKSDIYSVGVMFYEMLTGKKPFDTDNPVSIAVMHMQNVAVRPRDINPNIPSGLEEIIMHAMEKDASRRYQTATDMIRDIEAFKSNNQIIFGYYNAPSQTQYFAPPQNEHRGQQRGGNPTYEREPEEEYYVDGYEEEPEPERSKSLVVPILTAVTIVVVIVAAIICLLVFGQGIGGSNSSTDEIPNVIGMDYDDAVRNYPNVEFEVAEQEYTEQYEENIIYKQSIDAGQYVKKNDDGKLELAVAVSKGVQKVQIPDLTNYTSEEAQEVLKSLGISAELKKTQSTSDENIEANHVIRTDPEAGTEVSVGASVVLYVSQGVAIDETDVPNFVGMTLDEAKKECEHRKLEIEVTEEPSAEEKDVVIQQDPEPGKVVVSGSVIKLTVSNGEEPEGEVTYGLINLPSDMSGMYTLVFSTDEKGVIASQQFVAESLTDASVSVKVQGKGTQTVKVSITSAQSGKTDVLGTYTFDFVNDTFTAIDEDLSGALSNIAIPTVPVVTAAPEENAAE